MNSADQLKFYAFFLIVLASFAAAFLVYRQRKELGFLMMTIGLGIQVFLALFGVLARFGLSTAYMEFMKVAYPLNYLPMVFTLAGWVLLARKKPGAS